MIIGGLLGMIEIKKNRRCMYFLLRANREREVVKSQNSEIYNF